MMDWGGWGWWWVLMPLMMVAFWGLVAWVVITVVRGNQTDSTRSDQQVPPAGPEKSAEQMLAERFARGEIDAAEYNRAVDVLRATRSGEDEVARSASRHARERS